MANAKITNATLLADGTRLAQMISLEINRLLTDTANLRNSPYLSYAGSINGIGSDTIAVRKYGLGGRTSFKSATSENSDEAANFEDVDASSVNIQVARQYLIRNISDLASMAGYGSQDLNPFILASDMAASYETRFAELTSDAADSFTTIKGAATSDFTVDLFFEAISALHTADSNLGADGPYCLVMHPVALNQLQDSLRNETGNAVSMMSATADMLAVKGKGFIGNLFGVDIFRSSHVNDAAGAYFNYMLSPNAIGFADGVPTSLPSAVDFMTMGKILVEMQRDGTAASTQIIGHGYLGFNIVDQNKGLLVKSST